MPNLAYGPDARHRVDLYPAGGTAPGRLVLHVHGGGWTTGGKGAGPRLAKVLSPAGYSVAAMMYRLAPATDVAGIMGDVARAAAFLLGNAERFNLESGRFAVQGHSAGGHLAALLGTDQTYLRGAGVDPARLAGVLAMDGIFDITADLTKFPGRIDAAVFGADTRDWLAYSPMAHLDGMQAHPRFGILHEDTKRRFIVQARLFEAALRARGEAVDIDVTPGLSHVDMMRCYTDRSHKMGDFAVGFYGRAFSEPG